MTALRNTILCCGLDQEMKCCQGLEEIITSSRIHGLDQVWLRSGMKVVICPSLMLPCLEQACKYCLVDLCLLDLFSGTFNFMSRLLFQQMTTKQIIFQQMTTKPILFQQITTKQILFQQMTTEQIFVQMAFCSLVESSVN